MDDNNWLVRGCECEQEEDDQHAEWSQDPNITSPPLHGPTSWAKEKEVNIIFEYVLLLPLSMPISPSAVTGRGQPSTSNITFSNIKKRNLACFSLFSAHQMLHHCSYLEMQSHFVFLFPTHHKTTGKYSLVPPSGRFWFCTLKNSKSSGQNSVGHLHQCHKCSNYLYFSFCTKQRDW